MSMPTIVMTLLTCTMRLRPMRFITMAAGIDSSRNHTKTIEGMNPATVSLSPKSFFT